MRREGVLRLALAATASTVDHSGSVEYWPPLHIVAAISRDSDTTEVRGVGVVGWANWVICAKTDKDSSVSSAADQHAL
jgi:hypothetical protein